MNREIAKWYSKCLTEDEQMLFDERAAILEYHGELSRFHAEERTYQRMWEGFLTQAQQGEPS